MRVVGRGKLLRGNALRAAALGLVLAGMASPQAARAQFFNFEGGWGGGASWGGMDPAAVYDAITERGFKVLAPLRRNGPVFVADVLDRRGLRERLVVAAADAQVLRRFYLDDPRLPGFAPRDGDPGDEPRQRPFDRADRELPPVPPAVIPGMGTQGDVTRVPGPDVQPLQKRAPRPRVVERTPEAAKRRREPVPSVLPSAAPAGLRPGDTPPGTAHVLEPTPPRTAVVDPGQKIVPLDPAPKRPAPGHPDVTGPEGRPSEPPRKPLLDGPVADRPSPAVGAGRPNAAPRIVSGSVTGAPIPPRAPVDPAPVAVPSVPKDKAPADVPAAPLD